MRKGFAGLIVVVLLAVAAGGAYAIGRGSRPTARAQLQVYSTSAGRSHWVTLTKAGCDPSGPPSQWLGLAACSWRGKIRVASP